MLHLRRPFHREMLSVLVESINGPPGRKTSAAGWRAADRPVEQTGDPVQAGTEMADVDREIPFEPDPRWAFIPAQDTAIARARRDPALDE